MKIVSRILLDSMIQPHEAVETARRGDESGGRGWRQPVGHGVADERLEIRARLRLERLPAFSSELLQPYKVATVGFERVRGNAPLDLEMPEVSDDRGRRLGGFGCDHGRLAVAYIFPLRPLKHALPLEM